MQQYKPIEIHPLNPFIPNGANVLMCGTFPPQKDKWSMEFFYPNYINDMWRIMGYIFYDNKSHFVDETNKSFKLDAIKETLFKYKIAIYDTAKIIHREKNNASDKFLKIIEPLDLKSILRQLPKCKYIVTTGEKASSVIAMLTNSRQPKLGESVQVLISNNIGKNLEITHYRMPSTSRAFPMKIEKKAEYYKVMFQEIGIL